MLHRADLRRPRQPAGVPGRASTSWTPGVDERGASATSWATAPSPTSASSWRARAATSAWSATTTSSCTGNLDIADFSSTAATAAQWTREQIADEALDFLSTLEPADPEHAIGLYHASPRDPVWEYVLSTLLADACMDAMGPRVGAIGHSHVALYFYRDGGEVAGAPAPGGTELDLSEGDWIINPGGVGQPRDGDPRAAWLLLDLDTWTASGAASSTRSTTPLRRSSRPGLPERCRPPLLRAVTTAHDQHPAACSGLRRCPAAGCGSSERGRADPGRGEPQLDVQLEKAAGASRHGSPALQDIRPTRSPRRSRLRTRASRRRRRRRAQRSRTTAFARLFAAVAERCDQLESERRDHADRDDAARARDRAGDGDHGDRDHARPRRPRPRPRPTPEEPTVPEPGTEQRRTATAAGGDGPGARRRRERQRPRRRADDG